MKKLFLITALLLFGLSFSAYAPIVPVLEVPQGPYGQVFTFLCQALVSSMPEQKKAQIVERGEGKYKESEMTWLAYSEEGKVRFLFSVSLDPTDETEMKKKSQWQIFSSSPETFKKYSSEVMLINPEAGAIRRKLKPLVFAFGQYLPWTLIEPGFTGANKDLIDGLLKIMEKIGNFSELKIEPQIKSD